MRRLLVLWGLLLTTTLLAACGRSAPEQGAATSQTPTSGPSPTTATASSAPSVATAPVAPSPATATATPAGSGSQATTADGLPQSRTAEGYHVLGDPNAPVTLTMYSDFL